MSPEQSTGGQPAAERIRAAGGVALPAEATFPGASAVLEQALPGLEAARPLYDLSACRHFDSSLIAVLLELSRRASTAGRRCAFVGAPANLRKLAGLYGVEALLFGEHPEPGAATPRTAP
ncbi:MAG: STAS domain-containing protein [Burkholderiaceae bacterium]|nr:STAS domain-containing protein [Burkholderiaceae bacterium]